MKPSRSHFPHSSVPTVTSVKTSLDHNIVTYVHTLEMPWPLVLMETLSHIREIWNKLLTTEAHVPCLGSSCRKEEPRNDYFTNRWLFNLAWVILQWDLSYWSRINTMASRHQNHKQIQASSSATWIFSLIHFENQVIQHENSTRSFTTAFSLHHGENNWSKTHSKF